MNRNSTHTHTWCKFRQNCTTTLTSLCKSHYWKMFVLKHDTHFSSYYVCSFIEFVYLMYAVWCTQVGLQRIGQKVRFFSSFVCLFHVCVLFVWCCVVFFFLLLLYLVIYILPFSLQCVSFGTNEMRCLFLMSSFSFCLKNVSNQDDASEFNVLF